MTMQVAFLGLGNMGFPMAGHLARAGYDVTVYNRSQQKSVSWVGKYQGRMAATPADAARNATYIFSCVGNDEDLKQVTLGPDGAFNSIKAGSIFIDNTTTSATVAKELAKIAKIKGFSFLDAPVSGGQAGAENGTLTVMAGGDGATFSRVEPVMQSFSASIQLMGPSGYGQLTKMVNQICIAGLVQGLSEGINFAQHAGLDVMQVMDVIGKGAAQSWQMDNRHATMLQNKFDFGFAVDWMRKDLGIAMAEAEHNGSALPITKIVDSYYEKIQQNGGGRWDTSSLISLLEKKS